MQLPTCQDCGHIETQMTRKTAYGTLDYTTCTSDECHEDDTPYSVWDAVDDAINERKGK